MKRIAIAVIFLVAFTTQAQFISSRVDMGATGVLFNNQVMNKKFSDISGSPYLEDKFMTSEILGTDKTFLTRYNAYKDEIEISYENKTFIMPKDEKYGTIWNKQSNYTLKLVNYISEKNENIYGYLIDLYSDETIGVFKRKKTKLQKGQEAVNTYARSIPSKFISQKADYYLKITGDKIISFPQKKKDLFALYPQHVEVISKFIDEKEVSFKNEGDLIALTKFLGTL